MFSTSHLRSSTPGLSSRLSLKHMCYFSIRLPWPDSAVLCLSAHSVFPLKFPFLSPLFSLFFETNPFLSPFSLWPLLIYRSFAHAYTHTRTRTVCVLESEKVSVLFSGQLGLIFSTFCFHTLTDSPQAETERQRETHTDITLRTPHSEIWYDDRRAHPQPFTNRSSTVIQSVRGKLQVISIICFKFLEEWMCVFGVKLSAANRNFRPVQLSVQSCGSNFF